MKALTPVGDAFRIANEAFDNYFTDHRCVATVVLFSGGNDSTVLAHLFKPPYSDYFAHCNTGIGIEQTREFVRDVSKLWRAPLLEFSPNPGETYEELVVGQGFPGPGHHYKMYQRLKERSLRKVRRQLVKNPRKERVLFLAGRRRDESKRRLNVPELERVGSTVWASPLVHWTDEDMTSYRAEHNLPRNEVSDMLHMSGECLCGAFAKPGELDEIDFFFPNVAAEIRALEEKVKAAGHPDERCRWGWGAYRDAKPSKSGPMCSDCQLRFEM